MAGLPAASEAATGYHPCGGRYDSDAQLRIRSIRARKVSCTTARAVIRQYVIAIDTTTGGTLGRKRVFDQVDRQWTCSVRTAYTRRRHDPYGAITCALAGGRRVRANGYS